MAKNKKWSAATKFEIVLLTIKGEKTLNEICKQFDVAPSMVHAWKKQFLEQGAQVFAKTNKSPTAEVDHERLQRQLYEKVGKLTMERDFLKKSWSKFPGHPEDN